MERKEVLVSPAELDRQREFEKKIQNMFAVREAHPVACVVAEDDVNPRSFSKLVDKMA